MFESLARLLRATFTLALCATAAAASAQTSFSMTYKGGSTSLCGVTYNIAGKEPTADGKYPVFVYMVGTTEGYNSSWAQAAVDAAVARGMIAATVQYDNATFGSCSTLGQRAKCIFNPANANSAVARLCSRPKADCGKGVVTGGFSQGSVLSVLAKNHDSRVEASFGQGAGTKYSFYDLGACMADGKHAQPGSRLRIINGERDNFVGPDEAGARASAQRVTGLTSCSGTSCFQSNGSGWAVVKDADGQDRYADHCFMRAGVTGGACSGTQTHGNYRTGGGLWALPATMDWLKSFTRP
jgi:hypothetical protein